MIRRRIGAALCAAVSCLLPACGSGSGSGASVNYGTSEVLLRTGQSVSLLPAVAGDLGSAFVVTPALPAGLAFDPATGGVSGAATVTASRQTYTVSVTVGGLSVSVNFDLAVGSPLPTEVQSLTDGFDCTRVASLSTGAAKLAVAPDGRVFVTELTGSIRVIDGGGLLPTPFATVSVLGGGHLGLLGIALSPDFATDGFVFAYVCTPAGSGKPDRGRLLRWRDVSNSGTDETVLLDDLPVSAINNGGALCFDATGMLLLSVGDTEDAALAQQDASLAGKVLRVSPTDGSIPADNPDPASYVYAKGLRNTFALTLHPTLGNLFLADNGTGE